nr:hypothetical protein [Tanacetum cinerariifolium]
MNSPPNHECEQSLDTNDSDLRLTTILRPCNNHHIPHEITTTTLTLVSSQNPQIDNCAEKPVKLILGHLSIVQAAKLCKIADIRECGEECVVLTHEYIRKVVEDDDFACGSWVNAIEFVNVVEGIVNGVLAILRNFARMRNLTNLL